MKIVHMQMLQASGHMREIQVQKHTVVFASTLVCDTSAKKSNAVAISDERGRLRSLKMQFYIYTSLNLVELTSTFPVIMNYIPFCPVCDYLLLCSPNFLNGEP